VKSATGKARFAGVYDIAGVLEKEAYTGPRFPTRLKPLDEILRAPGALIGGGLIPGRVVFFVGGPGAGKTTFETQISLELAKQGLRLIMLLDDEPREAVAERFGQALGFPHFELGSPTRSTLAALREEQEKFDITLFPDPDDEARLTIEDAADYLLSVPNERGYVLAIDSLHKATCRAETDADTERLRIDKKINVLRQLRKRGVLVMATAEATSLAVPLHHVGCPCRHGWARSGRNARVLRGKVQSRDSLRLGFRFSWLAGAKSP
jgi:KaiC/GvpD/RAD55 family RecA-like ATPase